MKTAVKRLLPVLLLAGSSVAQVAAETMTSAQVLQKVMDHYPSLKTAALQVRRARQENARVQSQLGWQLAAQAGISRDINLFGTATDTVDAGGSLARQLEGGGGLSFAAGISRDDSETVLSPQFPNPSTSTSVDVNYRHPLQKGAGNPAYEQGLLTAQAGVLAADADRLKLYDQIASQVLELFYSASATRVRIDNLNQAIKRTQRLHRYIKDRASLGVSEDKDLLQVVAQLRSREAELKGLQVAWQQQAIALNRLMGRDWDAAIDPKVKNDITLPRQGFDELLAEVQDYNPDLKSIRAQLKLADAAIATRRDARRDQLDLVMFLGNRSISGDLQGGGSSDNSEVVGGLSLEFNRGVDKSGVDAELYKAQLERSIALQNQVQVMEDLKYDLSSLLAEIRVAGEALKAYRESVQSENRKLNEAEQRYRAGRTDTDQLVQFEAELAGAELAYELQRIELARRDGNLGLLRGRLWKDIRLPEYQLPELQLDNEGSYQ